jgi:hypothetical protein
MTASYVLPDPDPNSQLVEPSHAQLHTAVNHSVNDIAARVTSLETTVTQVTAPDGGIEQARMAVHTWTIPGVLITEQTNTLLIPLLWNLNERASTFSAAKASVMLPPVGADIKIDIVVSSLLEGNAYDLAQAQTSILKQPLVIPAESNTSITLTAADFVGQHSRDNWLGAAVTQIGSDSPGYDLTIQLNRLL